MILPKISGYVKTFKGDGVKEKNNKLMSFRIDDEKLLEKCKTIWIKIEDFKNIELNALPVYDDSYIKTKITYNKIYINFCTLNEQDVVECESVTVISIFLLFLYLFVITYFI